MDHVQFQEWKRVYRDFRLGPFKLLFEDGMEDKGASYSIIFLLTLEIL